MAFSGWIQSVTKIFLVQLANAGNRGQNSNTTYLNNDDEKMIDMTHSSFSVLD